MDKKPLKFWKFLRAGSRCLRRFVPHWGVDTPFRRFKGNRHSLTEKLKKEPLELRLERKVRGDDHEEAPKEVEEERKDEVEVDQEED